MHIKPEFRHPIISMLVPLPAQIFPFKSETKRMGIIVREVETGEITFYEKGADVVMMTIVQYNDWLEEETGNMAREGLRTLVVGKKVLTEEQYQVISSFRHTSVAHLRLYHCTILTGNILLYKFFNLALLRLVTYVLVVGYATRPCLIFYVSNFFLI